MLRRSLISFSFLILASSAGLYGCSPATDPDGHTLSAGTPDSLNESVPITPYWEEKALSPAEVVEVFYSEYLGKVGDRDTGNFTKPLTDGSYSDSEFLTEPFKKRIQQQLASFEKGGFDPILLAQDIPVSFEIQQPTVDGNQATAIMLRYWGDNPEPSQMAVHLLQDNGRWRIDNVMPMEILQLEQHSEPGTPDAVVFAFYAWYLAYIGDPATENFRNPLVDKAYQDAPYLAESFVGHVDDILAGFGERGGYDPFLCAQAIPTEITPDVTFTRNDMASVVVRSSFPNQRIVVDLRPKGNTWMITNITCSNDPVGIATAFYTWYLGHIGDRRDGDFNNPLNDKAYREFPLLDERLVQRVDETLANFDKGGFDPFLLAQDIPGDFSVDPGVKEQTAVVHLQFGPNSAKHLLIKLDETGWQIVDIVEEPGLPHQAPSESADVGLTNNSWLTFTDNTYAFSLSHPDDWVIEELEMDVPGQPDDWPVVAAWLLMPSNVAKSLSIQSGLPDPDAPIVVAPFNIEVVVGEPMVLERVYGELDSESNVIGQLAATVLRRDPGYQHVIFPHQTRPNTWLVITDWVTEFPGREAQAKVALPIWKSLLETVKFK